VATGLVLGFCEWDALNELLGHRLDKGWSFAFVLRVGEHDCWGLGVQGWWTPDMNSSFAHWTGDIELQFSFRVCEFAGLSYLLAHVWDLEDCEEAKLIHCRSHAFSSWFPYCGRNGRDRLRYGNLFL
jgi:hypothetical protein